ncbi:helix-turn-helix domain-containing protein [Noviherbaspirillum aerium]|uniref:helix-turn-helix domain-containing protein n=1 Tax=Noviherbaspirillum aerium TaxID=2588497 RepID=UPI00124E5B09|nr:helix-turn-helix domain-containing protein [Noviherbaspirillum aerium]
MRAYTLEDIVQPYQRYPKIIQQAILRAHTHPTFLILTKSMRKVLCALLTRASQKNGSHPIKARIDRVAEEAGVSEKTVQRAVAAFRQLGWMKQLDSKRSEYGLFTTRQYCFTNELCELVELPHEESKPTEMHKQETEMSAGPIYIDLSYKKDLREISIKNRETNPIQLPQELKAIVDMGVKDTGVCKLRGLAHHAGYRLEDIFKLAQTRLKTIGASGQRVYRYLLSMIQKQSDYAARAAQLDRQVSQEQTQASHRTDVDEYRGKRFTKAGKRVDIFADGDGAIAILADGSFVTLAKSDMPRLYAEIRAGKWVEQAR